MCSFQEITGMVPKLMENLIKMTETLADSEEGKENDEGEDDSNALYSKLLQGEDLGDEDDSAEYSFGDDVSEENEVEENLNLYKSSLFQQNAVESVKEAFEILNERDAAQFQAVMSSVDEKWQIRLQKAVQRTMK